MASRVAALVMAAGSGSRFGGGKLLAPLDGRPLLQHVLDRVAEAGVGEVVVVLGRRCGGGRGRDRLVGSDTRSGTRNPIAGSRARWRSGWRVVDPGVDAVLILLGDQPLVRSSTIRALIDAPDDPDRPIVVPAYPSDAWPQPRAASTGGLRP